MKKLTTLIILLLLLLSSQHSTASSPDQAINKHFSGEPLLIAPNQEAILKYNSTDHSFEWIQQHQPTAYGQDLRYAISRAPDWMEPALTAQLLEIENLADYINLLLTSPKHYVDEIAYCIAYAPKECVAPPDVLYDNVDWIYRIADEVHYADIKELNQASKNYGSTIQYRTLTQEGIQNITYPADIYYEYIVQPDIEWGNADYIYDTFWREYLWNHNDRGYPLLKEKLKDVEYLWDNQSYSQPANRIWDYCIAEHPTAIEALSYWVGKTVPAYATGDRPNQPNVIAHQHNGYCGELRTLATAATRTALIACIPISNLAEDHVWREFYEQGWHQADNWWADTGGAVDQFDVYRYGWGKEMSSVYANNPDDSTYDVTAHYLHPEDRISVSFNLENYQGEPIDGARIIVLVKGLNDISWIKYRIINTFNQIWNTMPPLISETLFGWLYSLLIEKITGIDDIQEFLSKSIWGITNAQGECSFDLGPGFDYTFLVQRDTRYMPYQYLKTTSILQLKNASTDANYSLRCFQPIKKTKLTIEQKTTGDYFWSMQGDAYALISGKNARTMIIGDQISQNTSYRSYVLDEENYQRYLKGLSVIGQDMKQGCYITDEYHWYLIIESHQSRSTLLYQKTPRLQTLNENNKSIITYPLLTNFGRIVTEIGETIEIHGNGEPITDIQIEPSTLTNNWTVDTTEDWVVHIDTKGWLQGDYQLVLSSEHSQHQIQIELIDVQAPDIHIDNPKDYHIVSDGYLNASGTTDDKSWVETVEISINRGPYQPVQGLYEWIASVDVSNLSVGEHRFTVKATDHTGNIKTRSQTFIVSGENNSDLSINEFFLNTQNITNQTHIIVYANCTATNYTITSVELWYHKYETSNWLCEQMFAYANHPVQERHVEDPLFNQTNYPIYGFELGVFDTDENISLYVKAKDSSGAEITSEILNFTVE